MVDNGRAKQIENEGDLAVGELGEESACVIVCSVVMEHSLRQSRSSCGPITGPAAECSGDQAVAEVGIYGLLLCARN